MLREELLLLKSSLSISKINKPKNKKEMAKRSTRSQI
jgi:hypothetical protein